MVSRLTDYPFGSQDCTECKALARLCRMADTERIHLAVPRNGMYARHLSLADGGDWDLNLPNPSKGGARRI